MTPTLSHLSLRAAIVSLSLHTVIAADGLWTNPAGGSWADANNWLSGAIAGGTGTLANFSSLDLPADATVTLDGDRTVRALVFADAAPGSGWTLNTGTSGVLTLADIAGTPAISVTDGTTTIAAAIAGNQGVQKVGAGTLTLSGTNTFTGNLLVTAGTLKAGSAASLGAAGAGNETAISSGATFDINGQPLTDTEIVRIAGAGIGGAGALVNVGGAQQNALNRVVLTSNATVGGTNRFDIRPGITPTLDLAGFTLTKTGANQFSMVGTAITPGNVVINQGIFSIETTSTLDASGSVTINSPGVLGLYGNAENLLLRPVISNNGTIQNLGSDANLNSPVTIASGTLTLTGFNTTQMRGVISGTGPMLKTGTGTFAFTQTNTFVGKTTATAGTLGMRSEVALGPAPATFQADQLTLDGAGIYTVSGGFFTVNGGPNFAGTRGITLGSNGGTFDAYGHGNARSRLGLASLVSGPGQFRKIGGGVVEILTPNTYTGGTTISGGPDISDTVALAAIQLGDYGGLSSGTVTFTNTGAINGLRFLTSGTFTNEITLASATTSRTRFVADGGVTAVIDGLIQGGAFDGPELQFGGGAGTIVLNADSTYASDTVVNGGTLLVNGALEGSDAFVKAGGAIGGSGTVRLLTLEEGSTIVASTPPLNGFFGVDAFKTDKGVSILVPGSSATPGLKTVDVVAYGDDENGVPPDLANFNTSAYRSAVLADDTANNKITLSYTSSVLTWNGTGPNWDVATSASWLEGAGLFYQGDAVSFTDPAAATTVTLAGLLAPSAVTVNNTTNAYTFSNTGVIASGSLVKSGTGMLVLTGANSYGGGTTINGGTLSLSGSAGAFGGNSGALGTGPVTVNATALLKLWINNNNTSYYNNPITLDGGRILGEDGINVLKGPLTLATGGGTLSAKWNNKNLVVENEISGPGKLTVQRETPSGEAGAAVILGKANSYAGGTDLFSGFLRLANSDQALGSGMLTFTGGSTLGTAANGGARVIANDVTINSSITGSFDTGFFPLTLTGTITGPGALTLASSGTLALSGNNSYTGGTNLNSTGSIRLDSPGALGTTGTITFGGGVLQHSAANTTDYSARFSTAANQAFKVNTDGQNVTWTSPLTSTGGSISKTGLGTLVLTGASTYTGGTNAQGGVIETALLSDTGATPIGTFSTAGASFLSFGGGTFRYTGSASVTTARYLWNDQVSGTFEVTDPAAVLTFTATAGTVNKPFTKAGAGGLVLADTIDGATTTVTVLGGSLTLNGANTYGGDTTVTAGSLTLATASLPNAADVRLASGTNLNLAFTGTDSIDQLIIGGVEMAIGTWGSTTSTATNKSALITGPGILNVITGPVSGSDYDLWATSKGLTSGNNGKTVDADNDGMNNFGEFAFDSLPLSGRSSGKITSKIADVGGEEVVTLTIPVRTGATFSGDTQKVSTLTDGVVYRIQGSLDLDLFDQEVIEVTGPDAEAIQADLPELTSEDWTYRTFRCAGDVSTQPMQFLRALADES